ncbi:MAG: glycosyltransferase [Vicinamibacterales bacterium]
MRLAWFSPLPPATTGIAAYSDELVPLLVPRFRSVDLYVDAPRTTPASAGTTPSVDQSVSRPAPPAPARLQSAHDFVWQHRRDPYDLIVYQLGNSDAHDYMWAYLFRYPGLVVLHDAQVHQARALWLLRRLEPRLDDYLAEVRANHPEAPPALGLLFAAALGGSLYRLWPLVALVLRRARLTAVHNAILAAGLRQHYPGAAVAAIEMGVADPWAGAIRPKTRPAPCGPVTVSPRPPASSKPTAASPEKRIPQLLEAVAAGGHQGLHVLLVGPPAPHYDVAADVARLALHDRVHLTGYVPDEVLPAHLAAADICWCLRWLSNGETSASWLRCLAAGRPTLITALAQLRDVPVLRVEGDGLLADAPGDLIGVAIDPVDEARGGSGGARGPGRRPGEAPRARARGARAGRPVTPLPAMADAYTQLIADASTRPAPEPPMPPHLTGDGTITARRLLSELGVPEWPL